MDNNQSGSTKYINIGCIKCSACSYWNRLDNIWHNVKNSKYGECSQPNIFGWNFMRNIDEVDEMLTSGNEILITKEYFNRIDKLENEKIIVGENFGCIYFSSLIL